MTRLTEALERAQFAPAATGRPDAGVCARRRGASAWHFDANESAPRPIARSQSRSGDNDRAVRLSFSPDMADKVVSHRGGGSDRTYPASPPSCTMRRPSAASAA